MVDIGPFYTWVKKVDFGPDDTKVKKIRDGGGLSEPQNCWLWLGLYPTLQHETGRSHILGNSYKSAVNAVNMSQIPPKEGEKLRCKC